MTVPRFWREQASRYNLIGAKCNNCGKIYFPPIDLCLDCHRASIGKISKTKLSGYGEVVTWTVVHDGPDDFKMQIPYIVAIIQLEEGPRVTGQLVDCDPSQIKIGMKVQSCFRKIREEGKSGVIHYGYKFMPCTSPSSS